MLLSHCFHVAFTLHSDVLIITGAVVMCPLQYSYCMRLQCLTYVYKFHVSPYGSNVDVCNSHVCLQFSYAFAILMIGSPDNADGNRQRQE